MVTFTLPTGGESSFGGNRSFQGGRRPDPDKTKYRISIAPINVIRCNELEQVHKNTMEKWMAEQDQLKKAVATGDIECNM